MKKIPNDLLRQAREKRGWSQFHLAEELGVEEQTVRSWERGTRFTSPKFRKRLCEVFGMTSEELGLQRPSVTAQSITILHNQSSSAVIDHNTSTSPHPVDKNRGSMLKRVYSTWIEGVLERSLYHATLLILELKEQPDALANPWRLQVQQIDEMPQLLPIGTRITEVYDEADGELLILGEPGAGKTTLLLELTRDLLERATSDEAHWMPVVFNLSSWGQKRQPFPLWMAQELNEKYGIPLKLAQSWVEEERILPLLDGLDEVGDIHRSSCIDALNLYRKEHGLVPMVVCSRRADYFDQQARLLLRTAIVVQPLTQEQIDNYIMSAGRDLLLLRQALKNDPVLLELASSPLMLNILALLAVDHSRWKTVLTEGSLIERRKLVFQQYVERVLHRGSKNRYTPEQTIHWLAWLAQQMQHRSQTEFYVERLQPSWLQDSSSRQRYYTFVIRWLNGIGTFITCALYGWLRGGNATKGDGIGYGLLGALGAPPGNRIFGWMGEGIGGGIQAGGTLGLLYALVVILIGILIRAASYQTTWTWKQILVSQIRNLFGGFKTGAAIGLLTGIILSILHHNILYGLTSGVAFGLITGLIYALVNGFSSLLQENDLSRKIRGGGRKTRIMDACFVGIFAWVGFVLGDIQTGLYELVVDGFILAVSVSLFNLNDKLLNDLGEGFGVEIKPAEQVAWSWQKVRNALVQDVTRGFLVGLPTTLSVTVIMGLASGLFRRDVFYGLTYGLVFGLIVGCIVAGTSILISILNSGRSSGLLDERQLGQPNEGIHRSLRNSLFAGIIFGVVGGILAGSISGFAFGFIGRLPGGIVIGLGFLIIFGLMLVYLSWSAYGGNAVAAHVTLRMFLWRRGEIALNYVDFLDYAAERILLRKIGGGYMFIHGQLRDYFATLANEKDWTNGDSEGKTK